MTDNDAIEYLMELKEFNVQGKMVTPKNENLGYDTFYECAFDHAIRALRENLEYRKIGTVEEFRRFAEKQKPKQPVKHDNCGNKCASERCPNCFEIVNGKYCEECGQAIDLGGLE